MFSVNHIAISVIDNEKSIEFYKKFGFKEFKKWRAEEIETKYIVPTDIAMVYGILDKEKI